VPMLLSGDELGRTQDGNNNAYCQDNPTGWVEWDNPWVGPSLADFVARCIALRRAHPVLRQSRFLHATARPGDGLPDVGWVMPSGREVRSSDWHNSALSVIGVILRGASEPHIEDDGCPLLIIINGSLHRVPFHLPRGRAGMGWKPIMTTAADDGIPDRSPVLPPGRAFDVEERSIVLLQEAAGEQRHRKANPPTGDQPQ
jgi:isoamylase